MANTIKHKRGTSNPGASDLVVGELAINTTSGSVFTKKSDGTVVQLQASAAGSFNADTLDNIDSSSFLRSDTNDDFTGTLRGNNVGGTYFNLRGGGGSNTLIMRVSAAVADENISSNYNSDYGFNIRYRGDLNSNENALQIDADNQTGTAIEALRIKQDGITYFGPGPKVGTNAIWHAGNDGAGSGLDADKLDGLSSSSFLRSDQSGSITGTLNLNTSVDQKMALSGSSSPYIRFQEGTTNRAYLQFDGAADCIYLWNQQSNRGLRISTTFNFYDGAYRTVWHAGNDGAGSGLDADQLDGQHGSYFLDYGNFSNTPTIPTNNNQLTNGAGYITSFDITTQTDSKYLRSDTSDTFTSLSGTSITIGNGVVLEESSDRADLLQITSNTSGWGGIQIRNSSNEGRWSFMTNGDKAGIYDDENNHWQIYLTEGGSTQLRHNGTACIETSSSSSATIGGNTIWHAGNDGPGSTLDADTLDGIEGANYLRSDTNDTMNGQLIGGFGAVTTGGTTDWNHSNNARSGNGYTLLTGNASNGPGGSTYYHPLSFEYSSKNSTGNMTQFAIPYNGSTIHFRYRYSSSWAGWNKIWSDGNDGAGSGLDADKLDAQEGSYYLNYNNFTNTPTIPTNNNQLTNGANYPVISTGNYNGTYPLLIYVNGVAYPNPNAGAVSITGSTGQITTPSHGNSNQWNTAYGWGNHASAGYLTSSSTINAATLDSLDSTQFLRSDTGDSTSGTLTTRDIRLSSGYHLMRLAHNSGHLEGGHNNIGSTAAKTSPIYTIGSSYNPADEALNNMYGIGFTHASSASFVNLTGTSGYGMYVASDGDARVFLDGSNGVISSTGQHYVGSNVVWNKGNDGTGTDLDADKLDGYHGTNFIGKNGNSYYRPDTWIDFRSGVGLYWGGGTGSGWHIHPTSTHTMSFRSGHSFLQLDLNTNGTTRGYVYANGSSECGFLNASGNWRFKTTNTQGDSLYRDGTTEIWDAGNDGSGSGLDADTLRGYGQSTGASNNTICRRTASGYIKATFFQTTDANDLDSGVTKLCGEHGDDGYIRHVTQTGLQNFRRVVLADNASQSGNSAVEYTGIPTWCTKITIVFHDFKLSSNDELKVQLGTSNGIITSGYQSASANQNGNATKSMTAGFAIDFNTGNVAFNGKMVIERCSPTSDLWGSEHNGAWAGLGALRMGGGTWLKPSSESSREVDRIKMSQESGSGTISGGSVSIWCE